MKIRYMSDLHLEICPYLIPPDSGDKEATLCLIGDICTAKQLNQDVLNFFSRASKQFKYVVWIPGNHEYYRKSLFSAEVKIREFLALHKLDNVHFLNKQTVILDDVAFIGATLWTDIAKGDPLAMFHVENGLNDYRAIRTGPPSNRYQRTIKPKDTISLHIEHKKFIFSEVDRLNDLGLTTVVMSHHAPSEFSVANRFKNNNLNPAYFSNLEYDIMDSAPDYWFHGHMHDTFEYSIGGTVVMCNPRGYANVWNLGLFDRQVNGDAWLSHDDYSQMFNNENLDFNAYAKLEI